MNNKYDFTSIMERKGKDAIAIDAIGNMDGFAPDAPDEGFDVIPMWIADMNFPTAPSVIRALEERVKHPAFGYFDIRDEYYDAIINWMRDRHGVTDLKREHIGYENGVLGGVSNALRVLCSRGDSVLVHAPTYVGFNMLLKNNGYNVSYSPLVKDADGVWRMDFADMEERFKSEHIHVAIFCSPYNPCGRVWTREELEKAYELFKKYDVTVICDEIWSDLLMDGNEHIPAAQISDDAAMRTITFYAPSKTFNISGLIGSYHVVYNPTLRDRLLKEASLTHYNSINVLSMHALIGAYCKEGAEWVDELCATLTENVKYAVSFIRENFKGVSVFEPEGTYMLFLDCKEWCEANGKTLEELEKAAWRVGVAFQDGTMFNDEWSVRINLALPFEKVKEAMERLKKYVF